MRIAVEYSLSEEVIISVKTKTINTGDNKRLTENRNEKYERTRM
jgi:hypothetical protein